MIQIGAIEDCAALGRWQASLAGWASRLDGQGGKLGKRQVEGGNGRNGRKKK